MPAERDMELGTLDLRYRDCDFTRSRVSKTVEARDCTRSSMRASMAATGIVRSGSSWRRRWYVSTMLEGYESVFFVKQLRAGNLLEWFSFGE